MAKRQPMQCDDIEKAVRLLSRAAERLKPYGTIRFSMEWLPTPKQIRRGRRDTVR